MSRALKRSYLEDRKLARSNRPGNGEKIRFRGGRIDHLAIRFTFIRTVPSRMLLHVVLSLLPLATNTAACQVLAEAVESGCGYDATLKLTGRPSDLIVQKENCSKEFVKTEWKEMPVLQMATAKEGKTYTVICIDPDALNHKKGEYYLHWLVSNVNGKDLRIGDLSRGKTITSYKGPDPVINTGLHRYIFLVFEEEKPNQNVVNDRERRKFSLLHWLESQTDKLCGPVAGVQFRSEY